MHARVLFLASVVGLAGCTQKTAPADATPAEERAADRDDDGPVRSVFPAEGDRHPLATRLCTAIQDVPRKSKATCCGTKPGVLFSGECTRMLSVALQEGAVTLQEPAVAACEQAMASLYQGCDWVGTRSRPLPPACQSIIDGQRNEKQACRSSLECRPGLYCHGVSPTTPGTCGLPRAPGGSCGRGKDALQAYLPDALGRHEACAGYCAGAKCRPHAAEGDACRAHAHCGPGFHCGSDRTCAPGEHGALGKTCLVGRCAPGLTCIDDTCQAPRKTGATCTADADCLGACLVDGQGPTGVCGMRCQ